MAVLRPLVYNRTKKDVENVKRLKNKVMSGGVESLSPAQAAEWEVGMRGSLSCSQLNRVDEWIKEVSNILTQAGIEFHAKPGKVWTEGEKVKLSDMNNICDNIIALGEIVLENMEHPLVQRSNTMSLEQANNIEYILFLCYNTLMNMVSVYPHSGQGLLENGLFFVN